MHFLLSVVAVQGENYPAADPSLEEELLCRLAGWMVNNYGWTDSCLQTNCAPGFDLQNYGLPGLDGLREVVSKTFLSWALVLMGC